MLKSFVEYARTYSSATCYFQTPIFSNSLNSMNISLQNTYHPILKATEDENLASAFVRSTQNSSISISLNCFTPMVLILGANMSGKTTLLKQLGCLQIMAQCGCLIPTSTSVSQCEFSLMRNISSVSCDYSDSVNVLTQSSFEQEMHEISFILKNLNDNSLLLIDELCRSTYFLEGFGLALALCIYILENALARDNRNIHVLFVTHFAHLTYLSSFYSKISVKSLKSILKKPAKAKTMDFKQESKLTVTSKNVRFRI